MPAITKQEQGLLFEDNFIEPNLAWTLSPSFSNSLRFGNDGLQVVHSGNYISYTINEPADDEYAAVMEIDHIPYDESDIAGMLVFNNAREYAECQTYMATQPSALGEAVYTLDMTGTVDLSHYVKFKINDEDNNDDPQQEEEQGQEQQQSGDFTDTIYHFIKMYKKNNTYTFYASPDNHEWIEVGNVRFPDNGRIGIFEHKGNERVINHTHCFIKHFAIYRSKYITIRNLPVIAEFEIHCGNTTVFRSDVVGAENIIKRVAGRCTIDTTTFPMPMNNFYLRFYRSNDYATTLSEYYIDQVYGGDDISIDINLQFFYNNERIYPEVLSSLGMLEIGGQYAVITVKNNDTSPSLAKKIKITRYSDYYQGDIPILMAVTSSTYAPGTSSFKKNAVLPVIYPGNEVYIYIMLQTKPLPDYFLAVEEFRFKISLE